MIGDRQGDSYGQYTVITGHEGTGRCWWCGGEFPDRRARRFCCEKCGWAYVEEFVWAYASARAVREHPYCADCGVKRREGHWDTGIYTLEVHHIDPLNGEERHRSAKNRHDNLVVLCHECHMKRHHPEPEPAPLPAVPLFDYAGVEV